MNNYKFVQNKKCEFFPCHKGIKEEDFNCLFCYCPLYLTKEKCGGDYTLTDSGIKDCSKCTFPHKKDNYDKVQEKLNNIVFDK